MHNIYVLGSMQDWLAAASKGTSPEAKQTAAGLQAYFAGMKPAGSTSANQLDNSQEGWDAGLEINWAVTSAGTVDETTVMHKLQHLDINTLGIVWARTPANYENITQVLAAMETIAPDGIVIHMMTPMIAPAVARTARSSAGRPARLARASPTTEIVRAYSSMARARTSGTVMVRAVVSPSRSRSAWVYEVN